MKDGWGSESNFRASYGLKDIPGDFEEGRSILDALRGRGQDDDEAAGYKPEESDDSRTNDTELDEYHSAVDGQETADNGTNENSYEDRYEDAGAVDSGDDDPYEDAYPDFDDDAEDFFDEDEE